MDGNWKLNVSLKANFDLITTVMASRWTPKQGFPSPERETKTRKPK